MTAFRLLFALALLYSPLLALHNVTILSSDIGKSNLSYTETTDADLRPTATLALSFRNAVAVNVLGSAGCDPEAAASFNVSLDKTPLPFDCNGVEPNGTFSWWAGSHLDPDKSHVIAVAVAGPGGSGDNIMRKVVGFRLLYRHSEDVNSSSPSSIPPTSSITSVISSATLLQLEQAQDIALEEASAPKKSRNVGVIVGTVIGTVIGVVILFGCGLATWKRRNTVKSSAQSSIDEDKLAPLPDPPESSPEALYSLKTQGTGWTWHGRS